MTFLWAKCVENDEKQNQIFQKDGIGGSRRERERAKCSTNYLGKQRAVKKGDFNERRQKSGDLKNVAIYNNENVLNRIRNMPKQFKILPDTKNLDTITNFF